MPNPRTIPSINNQPDSCGDTISEIEVGGGAGDIAHDAVYRWDEVVVIDRIEGSNTVIQFNYIRDRQDVQIEPTATQPHSRLNNIQVLNKLSGCGDEKC